MGILRRIGSFIGKVVSRIGHIGHKVISPIAHFAAGAAHVAHIANDLSGGMMEHDVRQHPLGGAALAVGKSGVAALQRLDSLAHHVHGLGNRMAS